MSVWREVGMECNADDCRETFEAQGVQAVVTHVIADARKAGWLVSRDLMTTYCPQHRGKR